MAQKKLSELINATPRQLEFLEAIKQFKFVLYGGAAGGGKSYVLQWYCVLTVLWAFARHGVRGSKSGLFCSTYTSLKDRHTSQWRIPSVLGKLSFSQNNGWAFTLRDALGGGMVLLRNLDDPSKYDSSEFIAIGVDEWTENPWSTFDELQKRLRWAAVPGQPHLPCGGTLKTVVDGQIVEVPCDIQSHHTEPEWNFPFAMASNPGGKSHSETKAVFIDRDFPENLRGSEHLFTYVQARVADNPYNPRSYIEALQRLPEELRKAMLDGDWSIFSGQYFSAWRTDVHTCEPFEIPWSWKIIRTSDWGEAKPCAHLWTATDPEGNKYVIHEVYGADMSIADQSAAILAFERTRNVQKYGILDSACFTTAGQYQGKSLATQYKECGLFMAPSAKGPGSRVSGWQMIKAALDFERDAQGNVTRQPKLKVFSTCVNFIRTVPALVHDKLSPEDLDTSADDHIADALRMVYFGVQEGFEAPREEMSEEDAAIRAAAIRESQEMSYA